MKTTRLALFAMILLGIFMAAESCQKSENPFDKIDRPIDSSGIELPFDTASISGLHRYIFQEKCAIPSCHGGTFEPDFRTPQSSWGTLVWAPVVKNTSDYRFQFRVIPGDFQKSWLHERCVTDDPILGRMPRYADPLTAKELFYIKKWITNGAKDINGQAATQPNLNARIYDVGAFGPNDARYDTIRASYAAPFSMPKNTDVYLVPFFYDNETPVKNLLDVKLRLSLDVNFSSFQDIPLAYNPQFDVWGGTLKTGQFPVGTVVFMRTQMRDADHQTVAGLPNNSSPDYMLEHYSFKIE